MPKPNSRVSMDFFTAQAEAQRRTRWLVFWFVLAVMGVIVVFYFLPVLLRLPDHFKAAFIMVVLVLICSFIATQMYYLWQASKLRFAAWCIPVSLVAFFFMFLLYMIFFHEEIFTMHENGKKISIPRVSLWDGDRFLWTCLIVGGFIALASLRKIRKISRHGGTLIAEHVKAK